MAKPRSVESYLGCTVAWYLRSRAAADAVRVQGLVVFADAAGFSEHYLPPYGERWLSAEEYATYTAASRHARRFEAFAAKRLIIRVDRTDKRNGAALVPYYYAPNPGSLRVVRGVGPRKQSRSFERRLRDALG